MHFVRFASLGLWLCATLPIVAYAIENEGVCHPDDAACAVAKETPFVNYEFTVVPLEDLTIEPITWRETGEPVTDNAFEVAIPDSVTQTLFEYAERLGITQKFRELFADGAALEPSTNQFLEFGNNKWYIQRPSSDWQSDIHWISPADEASHEEYLRALGDGGFDTVLETIGEALELDGLVCYQLTFIGVSHCEEGYIHFDFSDVDERAFNVIIPLILVEGSPPELLIEDEDYQGGYKYRIGAASVVGDEAYHGTAAVDYGTQFRMAATVYIADVNIHNVRNILSGYTQHYPPKDPSKLLSQAGSHWGIGSLPKSSQTLQLPVDPPEQ